MQPEKTPADQIQALDRVEKAFNELMAEHSDSLKRGIDNSPRSRISGRIAASQGMAQNIKKMLNEQDLPDREQAVHRQVLQFHDSMREASDALLEISTQPLPDSNSQPGRINPNPRRAKEREDAIKEAKREATQIRSRVEGIINTMDGAGMRDPLETALKTPEEIQDYAIAAVRQAGRKGSKAVNASPALKPSIDKVIKSAEALLDDKGNITEAALKTFQDNVAASVKMADELSKSPGAREKPDLIKLANALEGDLNEIKGKVTNAAHQAGTPKPEKAPKPAAPAKSEPKPEDPAHANLRTALGVNDQIEKLRVPNIGVMNTPGIKEAFDKISDAATMMVNPETDAIDPEKVKQFHQAVDETRMRLGLVKDKDESPQRRESAGRLIEALDKMQDDIGKIEGFKKRSAADHLFEHLVPKDLPVTRLATTGKEATVSAPTVRGLPSNRGIA